ncbi:MAG: hypothetical protein HY735_30220 [Verrucomicrobia bacterium]|nr:hypothetical protein [Verrucomicrobiota bacterium]
MQPAESVFENSVSGSTGCQPVPPGHLPDGTGATSMSNPGAGLALTPAAIPVGRLPTGAGKLPAPPIFKTLFEHAEHHTRDAIAW